MPIIIIFKKSSTGTFEGIRLAIKEGGTMICYSCKTQLILLQDRPNRIFLKDEEVEPVELKECPKCGREFHIYDKEAGTTITEMPQFRA